MILILHVLTAISSVAYTTYLFFSPSVLKLRISSGLAGLTLASGTYLVLSTHANMVHACVMGLIYFAIVSWAIVSARNKLARVEVRSK